MPCIPTLARPPETRALWLLSFPFVLEGAPQVYPLPTPLPLCPSYFRAWRFWAKQGSRAIPIMSFSFCCQCLLSHLTTVSTQQDKPLLRQHVPHKVNEPAWAHGMAPCPRVGQGRGMCSTGCHYDNTCVRAAARTFCLLLASAGCAPFFLLPACIARIQVSRETGCIGGI